MGNSRFNPLKERLNSSDALKSRSLEIGDSEAKRIFSVAQVSPPSEVLKFKTTIKGMPESKVALNMTAATLMTLSERPVKAASQSTPEKTEKAPLAPKVMSSGREM